MKLASAITLDNSQFVRAAGQSSRANRGQVSSLRSLITPLAAVAAGYLSVRGAIAATTSVLGQAGAAERTKTTFKVLLDDAEKAVELFDDLTEFSVATPFEPGPVQEAAKMLLAGKFEAAELRDLLTDAGDLASVMGVNLTDVAKVMQRLNSGDFGESFERLRDFGISRQDLEGEGLVFDRGGSFQGSIEQAMTAVRNIIQTRFGGTMQEVAQTNVGLMSTLRGAWKEVQREFGEPINDALKPVLREAIEQTNGLTEGARRWGQQVAKVIELFTDAFEQGKTTDLIKAGLELAVATFGNKLIHTLTTGATAFVTGIASSFENNLFPAIKVGFEGVASAFAAAITQQIPGAILFLQKKMVAPEVGAQVRKDVVNQGLVTDEARGTGTQKLTEAGRQKAAELNIDLDNLGFFKNEVFALEEALTELELDRLFDKSTVVGEQMDQAASKTTQSVRMLADAAPKISGDIAKSIQDSKAAEEDLFGQGSAQANLDREIEGIKNAAVTPFNPQTLFGTGPLEEGPLAGLKAFKDLITGNGKPPATPTAEPPTTPGDVAAGIQRVAADRLARIGGFVGGTSPTTDHARKTADNTRKLIELGKQTNQNLKRIATAGTGGNQAVWAGA